jgi:hypothetical protein
MFCLVVIAVNVAVYGYVDADHSRLLKSITTTSICNVFVSYTCLLHVTLTAPCYKINTCTPRNDLSFAHQKVFPKGTLFNTSLEQEAAVRDWLAKAGLSIEAARLKFVFYKGRYDKVSHVLTCTAITTNVCMWYC